MCAIGRPRKRAGLSAIPLTLQPLTHSLPLVQLAAARGAATIPVASDCF